MAAEAELELESLIANLVLQYLKDNQYTAAELAFTEECPYLSEDDEETKPPVSLEEIVGSYKKHKQADSEWEECGQGQMLNNLCTRLQYCVEEIKGFAVRAHKSTEKTSAIKSRSRMVGRSHRVNLMHPLQPIATVLTPTVAMPTTAMPSVAMPTVTMPNVTVPTPTSVIQTNTKSAISRSPMKRKGLSPQKCPPLPKRPALGVHVTGEGSSSQTSDGESSSGKGQQSSTEVEHLLEKMLNSHGLHQKLADSINQCATKSSSEEDEIVESVLHMTEVDPSFSHLLDSLLNMTDAPTPSVAPTPTTDSGIGGITPTSSHATHEPHPPPADFHPALSIDKFLDQLHSNK